MKIGRLAWLVLLLASNATFARYEKLFVNRREHDLTYGPAVVPLTESTFDDAVKVERCDSCTKSGRLWVVRSDHYCHLLRSCWDFKSDPHFSHRWSFMHLGVLIVSIWHRYILKLQQPLQQKR